MKARILSLILLTVFASAAPAQKNGQNRPPIIDVHMHAYAKDERWTHKVPNPLTGLPMTATTEQAHMQATLAEIKKYNIVKAVVSNDYQVVLRWRAASPDHILAAYGFDDPSSPDLEFLRREHAAGRLGVMGELGLQYSGVAPNDPQMEPYWALAEELDIPVGIHRTGSFKDALRMLPKIPDYTWQPRAIGRSANSTPKAARLLDARRLSLPARDNSRHAYVPSSLC